MTIRVRGWAEFDADWYFSPCVSPLPNEIHCFCDFLSRSTYRRSSRDDLGRTIDRGYEVTTSPHVSFITHLETDRQHWRSTFYLSTGLTAACLILGLFSIDPDEPSTETDQRVDWLGALLITTGLVLIVFVLSDGEIVGWKTPCTFIPILSGYLVLIYGCPLPDIIALLVLGVVFIILFLFWQRYLERIQDDPDAIYSKWTPPPLMKLSIWSRAKGRFAVMMAITFLNWSGFLAFNFFVQVSLSLSLSVLVSMRYWRSGECLVVLSAVFESLTDRYHDSPFAYVCHGHHLQFHHRCCDWAYHSGMDCWWAVSYSSLPVDF